MLSVIANSHPNDGQEWDCQCARCGSSLFWVYCEQCGGEGVDGHDCGDDTCCCAYPEDNVPCDICRGRGGWYSCASSDAWCKAHPLDARNAVQSGTPEWFVVGGGKA